MGTTSLLRVGSWIICIGDPYGAFIKSKLLGPTPDVLMQSLGMRPNSLHIDELAPVGSHTLKMEHVLNKGTS